MASDLGNFTSLYALRDPAGEIRYIGKTKCATEVRLAGHLQDAKRGICDHRCNWIRSLLERGERPLVEKLGEVQDESWAIVETCLISLYRSAGYPLTNIAPGGQSGYISEELQKKMAAARKKGKGARGGKGAYQTSGKHANLGVAKSEEHREKIRKTLTGRKDSEETLAKKRAAQRTRRQLEAERV